MERYDIVDEGDIILQVQDSIELRVYSQVLRLNSSVFRAMLGKDWAEGKALIGANAGTPFCLELPDDDPEAMKLLCLVLHNRDYLSALPSPSAFLKYAEVVDKYNCAMAATLFSNVCLQHFQNMGPARIDLRGYAQILLATIRLDTASRFAFFAHVLMFHWNISDLLNARCEE
ncbi:uncharacterized protein MYCFIDRAFT_83981 [Pseudocercospora fijiensis CIRAD86]|uniref:BTB domain-containing protein n=1 Tax=Pseudocercospora fijiensis (strain CIRAD86) TaxID=383855 RepID=M3AHA5_PSEFD|nr:uncharacterized protein MYCFIDRAFT_83981 [Pseudocercospora fijiensis CIRAD86]EME76882.1 hypothetical protein MYCFIDRAFT_83981 [Pseudocercospora fijiensis CIRAD86]